MTSPTQVKPTALPMIDELPHIDKDITNYFDTYGPDGLFALAKELGGSFTAMRNIAGYLIKTVFVMDYEHYIYVSSNIGTLLARPAAVQQYMHDATGGGPDNIDHTTTTDQAEHNRRKAAILRAFHRYTPKLVANLQRNGKKFAQSAKVGDRYKYSDVFGLQSALAMAEMLVGNENHAYPLADAIAAGMQSAGYVVKQLPTPESLLERIQFGQNLIKQLVEDHLAAVKAKAPATDERYIPEGCYLGDLARGLVTDEDGNPVIPEQDWWLEVWLAVFAGLDNLRGTAANTAIRISTKPGLQAQFLEAVRATREMGFAQAMQNVVLSELYTYMDSSAWQTVPVNPIEGQVVQLPNVKEPITSPYVQFFTSLPAVQMWENYKAALEGRKPRVVDVFYSGYPTCTGKEPARRIVMYSNMIVFYELGEQGMAMQFVGLMPLSRSYGVVQGYPWDLEFEIVEL